MDEPGTFEGSKYLLRTVVICCLIVILFSLPVMAAEEPVEKAHYKTLVLMYVVGSDLESGDGHESGNAATDDIIDLVSGYSNSSPKDLSILVGYGGSKKDGWEGLTIASIEDLIKDSADGVIGNEGISMFNDPEINMGSKEGLSKFFSKANEEYDGDNIYLIFWDHGDGFDGFGWDENTGDHLSISDITSELNKSERKYNLIGFDACLMSGIEVARALSPYADYMIGSEEISSGGWTYKEWVSELAKKPDQDPALIGKIIVDTFFHRDEPSGNTAALINLSKVEPMVYSLDELGMTLNNKIDTDTSIIPIARAYEKTTRFGDDGSSDNQTALKLDLYTLADYLAESVPEAKEPADKLKSALKDAIIYESHDELMSNATGLSIADPLTLPDSEYKEIAGLLSISPEWDEFIEKVRDHIYEEIPTPDLVSVGTNTYILKNPDGSADTSVGYFSIDNQSGDYLELGTLPVEPMENGEYELPEWDGQWMYLQDPNNPDQSALIDLQYGDTTGSGISKYISEVNLVRNGTMYKTIMYSYVDPDSNWTKYSFRPYETSEDGNIVFNRAGFTPSPGDSLVSYASTFSINGTDLGTVEIGEMDITGTPEIVSGILPDGEYGWALVVSSVTGESDIGDMHTLSIRDGVVTQSKVISEEE